MYFVSSVRYSFSHNGEVFGAITPKRGIRQGDPISPYIYIMGAEGLSVIIRRNEEDRENVCAQLEVYENDDPGKYLGMPMRVGRNKTSVFSFLVDHVDHKLQSWSMQNILNAAKHAWRLINNTNPLVTNTMKVRYYLDTDFLEAVLGASPSFMWHYIMASQELVKQGCKRKIGDGKNTRVWQISWLPCVDNGFFTSEFHNELKDIVVHNLMDEGHQGWDEDILKDLCKDRDREMIQQIPILGRSRPDSWYWILENHGYFSVKSCYRRIRGGSTGGKGCFLEASLGN
ncbi:uncharacterized protein LOC141701055 [Apium graveolens]|uniref:uncharacterized protein LOC141701055 n=1 Tax=Apium graveolens TaxID=4045 RepID=UPI003D7B641D